MAHKKSRTAGNGGFPNFCADARKRPKGEHRALFLGKCETVEVTPRIFQMHAYCFPNFCADARKRPKAEHQALFLGKCETVEKSRTAGSGKSRTAGSGKSRTARNGKSRTAGNGNQGQPGTGNQGQRGTGKWRRLPILTPFSAPEGAQGSHFMPLGNPIAPRWQKAKKNTKKGPQK